MTNMLGKNKPAIYVWLTIFAKETGYLFFTISKGQDKLVNTGGFTSPPTGPSEKNESKEEIE